MLRWLIFWRDNCWSCDADVPRRRGAVVLCDPCFRDGGRAERGLLIAEAVWVSP